MFALKTYDQSTMRNIANAAAVSVGAIFNIWPSKAALYKEATGHLPPAQELALFYELCAILKGGFPLESQKRIRAAEIVAIGLPDVD